MSSKLKVPKEAEIGVSYTETSCRSSSSLVLG